MRKMTSLAAVMALGEPVALADTPAGEKKEVGFAHQHRPVLFDGPIAVKSGPHPEDGPKVVAGSGTGAESHLDIDQYCIRVWGKWHSARIAPIGQETLHCRR